MSDGHPRVGVVGGGITGLAAAHAAAEAGADVVLVEASARLGGKIRTDELDGIAVDAGPDAFLARVPWATDLCKRLGLEDELVSPAARDAYVWSRGRLHRLPEGLVLGVPASFLPLARSRIVSARGVLRAGLDLVRPAEHRREPIEDEPVGALVRRRLGREVHERLVDPLIGGINAGDSDRLSLRAALPQLATAAERHRSLILGLRAQRKASPTDPQAPVFYSLKRGLGHLVAELATRLASADVRLHTRVTAIDRQEDGWRLSLAGPEGAGAVTVDGVVLTAPAFEAARLLATLSPAAARICDGIDHASVALVTMVVPSTSIAHPLQGSGFLVPRVERMLMTACTWASSKWSHLASPGRAVLRVSTGRHGDERALGLDDDELLDHVLPELEQTIGMRGRPRAWRIARWERSFPQYAPGHLDHVAALEQAMASDAPGVVVAGAAYRGIGIPACVNQGEMAANAVLEATAGESHRSSRG